MADASDVENALVALINSVVLPNGKLYNFPTLGLVETGVYRGWPTPDQLDADLAQGTVNITVFATPGMERNTTRYPRDWKASAVPAPTITATIDATGTIVTLGGTISSPQNVAIIANNVAVAYQVQPNDTLSSIAGSLAAALTSEGVTTTANNSSVTIAAAHSLIARVGTIGTAAQEVRRQNRLFQITFWCPTPKHRDAFVSLVDPVLAATNFLSLADGTSGRLIYQRTTVDDVPQKANLWRRDLFYTVEYGTIVTEEAAEAIVITTTMQGAAPPVTDFTETDPPPLVFNA